MADSRVKMPFDVALNVSEDCDERLSQPTTLAALLARLNQDHLNVISSRRHLADDTASLDVNVGDTGSCPLSDVSSIASWQNDVVSQGDELSCGIGGGATDESDSDHEDCDDDDDDDDDVDIERESMLLQHCIEAELFQQQKFNDDFLSQSHSVDMLDCEITEKAFDADTIKRTSRDQRSRYEAMASDKAFGDSLLSDENLISTENEMDCVGGQVIVSQTGNSNKLCFEEKVRTDDDRIPKRFNSFEYPQKPLRQKTKSISSKNAASSSQNQTEKTVENGSSSDLRSVSSNFSDNWQKHHLPLKPELCTVGNGLNDSHRLRNGCASFSTESISSDVGSSSRPDSRSALLNLAATKKLTSLSIDTAEDSLIDVPLDDIKNSVSLENDAEIAVDTVSIVSDDVGKAVTTANGVVMPSVEDGLSSSDISDTDDAMPNGDIDHCLSVLSDLSLPDYGTTCRTTLSDDALEEEDSEDRANADSLELSQFKAAVADCLSRSAAGNILPSPKKSSLKSIPEGYVSKERKTSDIEEALANRETKSRDSQSSDKSDLEAVNLPNNVLMNSKPLQQQPYEAERESFLIEGVLFRARYLGSTQLISEGQPSKAVRMLQAQEAIGRIKQKASEQAAAGAANQPSTLVDLFVSVEKIMVLNTDLQEIMMDHALRTISYIADIGDLLVVMARRGPVTVSSPTTSDSSTTLSSSAAVGAANHSQTKICCHVFESDEAQLIAQSISQAFQVAYMEFLKANGINDPDLMKEMDYQDVLSQQAIFGEELFLFSNKDMQKEIIVPKVKNEPLGIVIVESGWGSMVPTIVLASMAPGGAAARCGQLNVGDQIMSINGVSLVGLPLSTCQNYIKAVRSEILVRLMAVSCTPVVEVLVKRPGIKYQLGFSVQNGVICSLLRGGIAERGGVRVGHRIIEINGQSVVAVPHEKIVSMLATSVGEIHMKTMQTSVYRLLTGQDTPHYI